MNLIQSVRRLHKNLSRHINEMSQGERKIKQGYSMSAGSCRTGPNLGWICTLNKLSGFQCWFMFLGTRPQIPSQRSTTTTATTILVMFDSFCRHDTTVPKIWPQPGPPPPSPLFTNLPIVQCYGVRPTVTVEQTSSRTEAERLTQKPVIATWCMLSFTHLSTTSIQSRASCSSLRHFLSSVYRSKSCKQHTHYNTIQYNTICHWHNKHSAV
jgi:hypothetical protein